MNSQRSLRIAITVVLAMAGCTHNEPDGGTGGTGASAGSGGQVGGTTGTGNSTGAAGSFGSGSAGTNGGGHAGTNSPAGGTTGQTGGTTGAAGSAAGGTSGTAGGTNGQAGGTSGQAGGSGGHAGGTSGQAGGTSGGAGGSTLPAGTCTDDIMNGTETGVDCGGSCPACPSYQINPPNLKNTAQSGCQGGTGFMCTRSMAFSPEFKQAAHDDAVANGWNAANPPFVYGVVGHDKDSGGLDTQSSNTCCQCYQLVFESPSDPVSGLPTPKPMIVQAFNTAAGGAKNFDIYMAKGGEGGNTNGCSALYTTFPTIGEPGSGGIRPVNFPTQCASMNNYTEATVASSTCQQQIASQCDMITSTMSASIQSTSQQSCIEANQPANLYHLNWKVRAERVECPTNLTRVTGCKLKSQNLPQPDPNAQSASTAGSGFVTGYGTTTMQDCCRPTCAYQSTNNVDPNTADSQYGIFYTCDKSGNVQ